jgi:hypothetical protein
MKIRIPIPQKVLRAFEHFEDWANVPVWLWPWHNLRLDIVLLVLFLFCVSWYYYTLGLLWAITGGLLFIFIGMCALWIWKR